ncbi:MAG TPA: hypothetical protein P5079_11190, partial [Elusimicrobiota bacterium]|nr:hypothetical protein [Elusimicrobiota bacterium]
MPMAQRGVRFFSLVASILLVLPAALSASDQSLGLMSARDRGTFNIGPAQGKADRSADPTLKKDIVKFEFSAPAGSVAGVWTKNYPSTLTAATVSDVKIAVNVPAAGLERQIAVSLELKGTKAAQVVPLSLQAGWNIVQKAVEWGKIGDFKEAVFVVSPAAGTSASGTVYFDLDFIRPVSAPRRGSSTGFGLLDARERGAFNMGAAKGNVALFADDIAKKDVLKLDYSAPQGSAVGLWTKAYPSGLGAASVNAVNVLVNVPSAAQVRQVSLTLELKGTRVTQSIPLPLKTGRNSFQERVEWDKIGDLKEVVFVVSPVGGGRSAAGSLFFDLEFVRLKSAPDRHVSAGTPLAFSVFDARERGVFNMGASKGTLAAAVDPVEKKDVLKFGYTVPQGTAAGVWIKGYPAELGPGSVNAVKVGVNVPAPDQPRQVSVTLEFKGTRVTQSRPLSLQPGWNTLQEIINWDMIGDLKEVVFVVTPVGGEKPVSGVFFFTLDFLRVTELPKPAAPAEATAVAKSCGCALKSLGGIFLIGLLLALGAALVSRLSGRRSSPGRGAESVGLPALDASLLFRLKRDILYGAAATMLAGTALGIYVLGTQPDVFYGVLAVGVAGGLIAEALKFAVAGKHLTPGELFQNVFLTGLLAATSSGQVLWQAPATWTEVLMKSNLTVALACLAYHVANACSLFNSGKHLRPTIGALIVGTPYLFGWLLMLENVGLLRALGFGVAVGTFAHGPAVSEALGRLLVVFAFNEAVTALISLATKGRLLKTPKAHLYALLVS